MELIEKPSKGELPLTEYPSMSEASSTVRGTTPSASATRPAQTQQPMSMRSRRTPTWAKSRNSDDAQSSDSLVLRHASALVLRHASAAHGAQAYYETEERNHPGAHLSTNDPPVYFGKPILYSIINP